MNKTAAYIIYIAAILFFAAGCGPSGNDKEKRDKKAQQESAASVELPLPVIPAKLTSPEERADYLAMHFWDAMDWQDRSIALDSAFIEQNFANYLSGLPYTTDAGLNKAVSALLDRVRDAGSKQLDFFYDVATRYLYKQDSPLRYERAFLAFADWAIAADYNADRAKYHKSDILHNAPGSEAPDFSYELSAGGKSTLHSLRGCPLLLMFYEPDCDQCAEAERVLSHSEDLRNAINAGQLKVLAVYVGDKRELWKKHAGSLPADWIVGIDREKRIDEDELYNIRATPSFYLIDPAGKIVLKDAALSGLISALSL